VLLMMAHQGLSKTIKQIQKDLATRRKEERTVAALFTAMRSHKRWSRAATQEVLSTYNPTRIVISIFVYCLLVAFPYSSSAIVGQSPSTKSDMFCPCMHMASFSSLFHC